MVSETLSNRIGHEEGKEEVPGSVWSEEKMRHDALEVRVKYIRNKLANAKGQDPQQELDEEAVENYQLELEKLEKALDRALDMP